jgi:hypothetical protein
MIEYKLEKRFETPHELGGVPSFALTRDLFEKVRHNLITGRRPVPAPILAKAKAKIMPPSDPPKPPADLMAATRSLSDNTGSALLLQRQLLGAQPPASAKPKKATGRR